MSGAVSGHARKRSSGSGARSGAVMEWKQSSEQTRGKLAAQTSLKGDMLLKLCNALQTLFYPVSRINHQPEF